MEQEPARPRYEGEESVDKEEKSQEIEIVEQEYRHAINELRRYKIVPNKLMEQEPTRFIYEGEESVDEEEKSQELS